MWISLSPNEIETTRADEEDADTPLILSRLMLFICNYYLFANNALSYVSLQDCSYVLVYNWLLSWNWRECSSIELLLCHDGCVSHKLKGEYRTNVFWFYLLKIDNLTSGIRLGNTWCIHGINFTFSDVWIWIRARCVHQSSFSWNYSRVEQVFCLLNCSLCVESTVSH
jgi:hypothetical protein